MYKSDKKSENSRLARKHQKNTQLLKNNTKYFDRNWQRLNEIWHIMQYLKHFENCDKNMRRKIQN